MAVVPSFFSWHFSHSTNSLKSLKTIIGTLGEGVNKVSNELYLLLKL
jgi:hypothetical protein